MNIRIIPRLDIKGEHLVKGIQLEGLRKLGKPEEFAQHYYHAGADELLYMDIVASLYERQSLLQIVQRTAREVFIPLTVGGGLRSLDDIRAVLLAGADKVAVNTAAIQDPEMISQAANRFGSSTIVVSIEAKRRGDSYEAYVDNGRERTGKDVLTWARQAADLGAGEIMVTAIDREGMGQGYDLALTRAVSDAVGIPVIACGGCGEIGHVERVVVDGHADAAAMASILHYDYLGGQDSARDVSGMSRRPSLLGRRSSFGRIRSAPLSEVKAALRNSGVDCRMGLVGVGTRETSG